ncbi:MAG: hypothetical protein WCI77_07770 [Candidatus Omnitrophota bacterium]
MVRKEHKILLLSLFFTTGILLYSFGVQIGNLCGNGVCQVGENSGNCQADCRPRKITQDPFGIFVPYLTKNSISMINELAVDARTIVMWDWITPRKITAFDDFISQVKTNVVLTLGGAKKFSSGGGFPLPRGKDLEEWKTMVARLVERYDGDNDWGCALNQPDCYNPGDGLYPNNDFQEAIKKRPIKYWQIENEWLWEIKDPDNPQRRASNESMLDYFLQIRKVIKDRDSRAKIVLGASTTSHFSAGADGYSPDNCIEWGDLDCKYEKLSLDALRPKARLKLKEMRERDIFFMKKAAPYYDVFDFHIYGNNLLDIAYVVGWFNKIMHENNIAGKAIWSTEIAKPYFFFPLMGLPRPDCATDDKLFYPNGPRPIKTAYDSSIHSSYLVKLFVIGIDSGVEKMFYAGLHPIFNLNDNFCKLSLTNERDEKKPAYYTYKLMREKLAGCTDVEKLADHTYKFSFGNKKPVFVVWGDSGNKTIDLSRYIGAKKIKVTRIITENGKTDQDALVETLPVSQIEISVTPVFIEEADKENDGVRPSDVR